jgi:cysteine desulfurase
MMMIYFDNSATTQPWPSVLKTFTAVSEQYFGNPSSLHPEGARAQRLLDQARSQTADLLGVEKKEVVFTSGATEANVLALTGAAEFYRNRGKHIVTSAVEHPSVLETLKELEKKGWEITYVSPDTDGNIRVSQIEKEIRSDTVLVSLMHINNEIGSIYPVEEIGKMLRDHPSVLYHVDYVQGAGKIPLDVYDSGIDYLTISGHKFHSVKGTGALIVRNGRNLHPLFHGGGQESKKRSGTENTPGAAAMAKALRLSLEESHAGNEKLRRWNTRIEKILRGYRGVTINSPVSRAPHILNFSVNGMKPEIIVQALASFEIFVSTTSACASKAGEESHVLKAMNLPDNRAAEAVRISFSYDTKEEEIESFIEAWDEVYASLIGRRESVL